MTDTQRRILDLYNRIGKLEGMLEEYVRQAAKRKRA